MTSRIGEAIAESGPSIILAFVLAGVTCAFSALAYAELASSIPVSGSAYTYAYATLGELVAWIIGWDLILEYAVSVAGVSVGWGGYLNELLDTAFGFTLPDSISSPPPVLLTAIFGLAVAVIAALVPLTEIVKLVNIGTLFAFVLVNIGLIILRRTRPDLERGFRVPLVPLFPIIGVLLCGYLMSELDRATWIRFVVWLVVGLAIYFLFSRRHSRLRNSHAG